MKEIDIGEFGRLDIRVGKVASVNRVPNSRKLLELIVDLGGERKRCVAGLAGSYEPEELLGKSVVVLANIKPRKIFGIESQVMLLAAVSGEEISLLQPDKPVPPGSKVS